MLVEYARGEVHALGEFADLLTDVVEFLTELGAQRRQFIGRRRPSRLAGEAPGDRAGDGAQHRRGAGKEKDGHYRLLAGHCAGPIRRSSRPLASSRSAKSSRSASSATSRRTASSSSPSASFCSASSARRSAPPPAA